MIIEGEMDAMSAENALFSEITPQMQVNRNSLNFKKFRASTINCDRLKYLRRLHSPEDFQMAKGKGLGGKKTKWNPN
jgi:hypothetical protein